MTIDLAVSLLLALIDHASQISSIIANAKAQGRSDLTATEWTTILASDDKARAALLAALSGAISPPAATPHASYVGSGGTPPST